eukprot:TRINITY_DN891_c0_g1_i2.p1 TRINITY_DN891_c0_g1~~TRINITY_DN891_c0_g1_i2.p1  ORF type:complete len:193 (-),score=22.53 TRINITY_DN891_c0_g1_i2:115-627(-)
MAFYFLLLLMQQVLCRGEEASPTYEHAFIVKNTAKNNVSLMTGCTRVSNVSVGASQNITVPRPGAKYWIAPEGFKYDCHLDCLGCFYISANVAPSGALVAGIGYGENGQVISHDGIGSLTMLGTREDSKTPDQVLCDVESCDVNHIVPGFNMFFIIDVSLATNFDEALLV